MSLTRRGLILALLLPVLLTSGCDSSDSPQEEMPAAPQAEPGLVLLVHPFDTPSRLLERFSPITEHLSKALGKPVKLEIARTYIDQIRRIAEGQADLAYMGPTPFFRAQDFYLEADKDKLIPLAEEVIDGQATYRSVIVTRKDGPVHRIEDLNGHLMAFGAHHSYSSHYVPRVLLLQHGIDLYRLKDYAYLGRHERVALAVLHGDFDAGGLRLDVAKQYLERTPGLRILATSPPLPPHLIVASPHLDDATRQRLRAALLDYRQETKGNAPRRIAFAPPDHVLARQVRKVVEIVERRHYDGPWPW
ncbi:MAG: phosphate/phosphite/phosphonate ABC transporter substrate-binding protein [Gammaproteobacteria bacterium]|nr:MAG: phosphate/phosphite/phosphonate ABC transporter substrate-binding protein [Gammaproteobacteria bacterium]